MKIKINSGEIAVRSNVANLEKIQEKELAAHHQCIKQLSYQIKSLTQKSTADTDLESLATKLASTLAQRNEITKNVKSTLQNKIL